MVIVADQLSFLTESQLFVWIHFENNGFEVVVQPKATHNEL